MKSMNELSKKAVVDELLRTNDKLVRQNAALDQALAEAVDEIHALKNKLTLAQCELIDLQEQIGV